NYTPARFFTLWDAAEAEEVCSVPPLREGYRVQRLLFSPDGRMLATASNRNGSDREASVIHLWPLFLNDAARRVGSPRALATEGLPFVEIGFRNGFNSWAFSPDGRTLALCGDGGTVSLVETANGKERTRFKGHGEDVTALAFAPDGRRLASGSR